MARDPSYAEYVDARWFVLYRLAALLVGEEHAGSVTEAALVRAYLHWHDVEEAASSDAYVEGLLARTAIQHVATRGTDGRRGHGLDALSPRQRAVVVLRCFELLDHTEIARALGSEVADVDADWAAGLAAVGLGEQQLAEELERLAEATSVPPPPVDVLLSRSHDQRRRGRRRGLAWTALVAMAAVVALAEAAVVHGLWGRREPAETPPTPATLARLPVGQPPRVAYTDGLTVYVRGGPLIVPHAPTAVLQAGPWVYLTFRSGEVDRVDGRSLALTTLTKESTGEVVADRSGRYVAWVEAGEGERRPVVVVRVIGSRGETLRQQQRAFPAGIGPFVLAALDRNGDVFGTRPAEKDGVWVWRTGLVPAPGRRVLDRITGVGNSTLRQVVSGDVVAYDPSGWFSVGPLHGSSVIYDEEVYGVLADFADPRTRRVVYVADERLHVAERGRVAGAPPREQRLRLPRRVTITALRWEDDRHVLADVTDASMPQGALVRCDVGTAACELAATLDGPHLLAR